MFFQFKNQELDRSNQKNIKEKNLMKKFLNDKNRENEKKHEEIESGLYKSKTNINDVPTTNEINSLRQEIEQYI